MIEPGRQLTEEERQERAAENARITQETLDRANRLREQDIAAGEKPIDSFLNESIKNRIEGGEVVVPPNVEDSLGQAE